MWGRDANRVSRAAGTLIPFCEVLADILERNHTVAPRCAIQCLTSRSTVTHKRGIAVSQPPPSSHLLPPYESFKDLASLWPLSDPQKTQELDVGQDGDNSEDGQEPCRKPLW